MAVEGISVNRELTRRSFLGVSGVATLAAAACSPQAPVPAAPAAQSPASAPSPAGWEREWNELVTAAKREGKVSVACGPGQRFWVEAFEAAFPGITADFQELGGSAVVVKKISDERQAGVYAWDNLITAVPVILSSLKPIGVLESVAANLVKRPDIVDDKNWTRGFDSGWVDKDKRLCNACTETVGGFVTINKSLISENEIKPVDDLLNPKGKGKIVWGQKGTTPVFGPATAVRLNKGDEFLKRLIVDQQSVFASDNHQMHESLVRGRYPIAISFSPSELVKFTDAGAGKDVAFINVPELTFINSWGVWMFNKPAHPNAAKLFANWSLTRAAGDALAKSKFNPRRADSTPPDPIAAPRLDFRRYAVSSNASAQEGSHF